MTDLTHQDESVSDSIIPKTINYYPEFVSQPKATYEKLLAEIKPFLAQHTIIVYGNYSKEPRLGAFFSPSAKTTYTYSKAQRPTYDMNKSPTLVRLLQQCRTRLKVNFNSCLVNYYRDGNDCIGEHSDNETDSSKPDIASISLGAKRDFIVKTKPNPKTNIRPPFPDNVNQSYLKSGRNNSQRMVLAMPGGCMIHMTGECQQKYKHAVPRRLRVKTGRINITFRCL